MTEALEASPSMTTANPASKTSGKGANTAGAGMSGPGRASNPSVSAASAGQQSISLTPAQMIASSTSYLPSSDKGSKIISVETINKPRAAPPTVPVAERVQRIEKDRTTEATSAYNTPTVPAQQVFQIDARTITEASPPNKGQGAGAEMDEE